MLIFFCFEPQRTQRAQRQRLIGISIDNCEFYFTSFFVFLVPFVVYSSYPPKLMTSLKLSLLDSIECRSREVVSLVILGFEYDINNLLQS